MKQNRYEKMSTEKLLELQMFSTPGKWILVVLTLVVMFNNGGGFSIFHALMIILVAWWMFFGSKRAKEQIDKALEERSYSELDKQNAVNKGKRKIVLYVILIIFLLFCGMMSKSGGSGSSSKEPWKELGVSKKEYMDVYNHYKYGTPIR